MGRRGIGRKKEGGQGRRKSDARERIGG